MPNELIVMAVGDVTVGTRELPGEPACSQTQIWEEGVDPYRWLEQVAPVLKHGDFTIGNLMGTICDIASPAESKSSTGGGNISMPPKVADVLKRAGFHAFSVANNHTMDFGPEGMLQTLTNLKRVGLGASGGGRNIQEARKPVILEQDGVKLALLSYSSVFMPGSSPAGENKPGMATVSVNTSYQIPGNIFYNPGVPPRIITTPNREDVEKMLEDVREAKAQADLVVVNWHWGSSKWANSIASGLPIKDSLCYVLNYQEDMGRAAIDSGADLVVGHQPHRLQGVEIYKGKFIFYSLGVFTFPFSMGMNFGEESGIVKGYIDSKAKRLTRVHLLPVLVPMNTMQPHVVPVAEAARVITELERLSQKYKTKFTIKCEEIVIEAA